MKDARPSELGAIAGFVVGCGLAAVLPNYGFAVGAMIGLVSTGLGAAFGSLWDD